jgi:hypothetical protein
MGRERRNPDDVIAMLQDPGGFSATLSDRDRIRLRAIIKSQHLKHYPKHMITDYEADKMIDVIAPDTVAYLIRKNWKDVK